jgi:hypothetical protein
VGVRATRAEKISRDADKKNAPPSQCDDEPKGSNKKTLDHRRKKACGAHLMLGRCLASGMAGRMIHFRATATAALVLSCMGGSASSLARNPPIDAFLGGMNSRDSLTRAFATTENGVDATLVLPYQEGSLNSAKICIPTDAEDGIFAKESFQRRLETTVEACRALKKSSLWVEVPMSRASLIEDMEEVGLEFHHAVGTSANLCLWLRRSNSKIPEYATHHVVSDAN